MRNIKLLWGLTACLLAAVLVLGLMLARERSGNGGGPGTPEPDRVVAKVAGREFKLSTLQENLIHKYGPELLDQLLNQDAIRLEAEAQGVKLSREDVDAELKRMQQGYDSEELFYESMRSQVGLSKEEIREDVYYKLLLERLSTKNIKVTEEEITAYIKEHPEEFQMVSNLRIEIIVNQTVEQARRTIELYKGGKDFAQLARERSLDTATAAEGGDLGWVEDNDPFVPQEILKAARGLKVGDIAGPIETAEGFAVIRLKDKKDQSKGSTEQIKENVRKMLLLQKAPPMQDVLANLRSKHEAIILDSSLQK